MNYLFNLKVYYVNNIFMKLLKSLPKIKNFQYWIWNDIDSMLFNINKYNIIYLIFITLYINIYIYKPYQTDITRDIGSVLFIWRVYCESLYFIILSLYLKSLIKSLYFYMTSILMPSFQVSIWIYQQPRKIVSDSQKHKLL